MKMDSNAAFYEMRALAVENALTNAGIVYAILTLAYAVKLIVKAIYASQKDV